MSKLVEALKLRMDHRRFLDPLPIKFVTPSLGLADMNEAMATRWVLSVTIEATTYVRDRDIEKRPAETRARARAELAKLIVEQVFGEFRPALYDLHDALHNRDYDAAKDAATRLEQGMFSVREEEGRRQ